MPLSPLAGPLGFTALPPAYWAFLVVIVAAYLGMVEVAKWRFQRRGSAPDRRGSPRAAAPSPSGPLRP